MPDKPDRHKTPLLAWHPSGEVSAWVRAQAQQRDVGLAVVLEEVMAAHISGTGGNHVPVSANHSAADGDHINGGNTAAPASSARKAKPRAAPKAAPPVAAIPAEFEQADTDTRAACKHPTASINEIGVCECGTEMDPA